MKKSILLGLILISFSVAAWAQKQYVLVSPNGKVKVEITSGNRLTYSVSHSGDLLLEKSPISMKLTDGRNLAVNTKVKKTERKTINESIEAVIYKKNTVTNHYNELKISYSGGYGVIFRAYDDGVAYRFTTEFKNPFFVENEQADFTFPQNRKTYLAYVDKPDNASFSQQFFNSYENTYNYISLDKADAKKLAFLPLVVDE